MLGQSLPWRKLTAFSEVTMEFSCSSQQETEVWRRRLDGPWGELWMVLHSDEVAMICNNAERSMSKDEATSATRCSMVCRSSLNSRCIQVFQMKLSTYPPIQWPPFSLLSHPDQQTEGRFFPSHPSAQDSPWMWKDLMRLCYNTPPPQDISKTLHSRKQKGSICFGLYLKSVSVPLVHTVQISIELSWNNAWSAIRKRGGGKRSRRPTSIKVEYILITLELDLKTVRLFPNRMVPPICPGLCSGISITFKIEIKQDVKRFQWTLCWYDG